MKALVIGRFQPFHKGHLAVVKEVAAQCQTLYIGIGSAQYSHTFDNPFSAGERYDMIRQALVEAGINNCALVPVTDIHRYGLWAAHVMTQVPQFDVFFGNAPLVSRLFAERGVPVKSTGMYDRERYCGTHIRALMRDGGPWQELVPPAVADFIGALDGPSRLRDAAGITHREMER